MRDICISVRWSGELKGIDDLICLDPLLGCPFRNSSHFQIGDILILFGWRFYVESQLGLNNNIQETEFITICLDWS